MKARASLDEAAESLMTRQQRPIAAAAEAWIAGNPDAGIRDLRFDVILVAPSKLPRHIETMFES